MGIFRCKMCGGDLEIIDGQTVSRCEYCGSEQTLPKLDDEKKIRLFSGADKLRYDGEFDKAAGVYENIISEFPGEPEAYWGIILCKYGIEYVDDPVSHKRVPFVNRAQYTSVFADESCKSALEKSDASQRAIYEEEARQIEKIRKEILEISRKERPYDVFICCNEIGTDGRKTVDAVLAAELYHRLTDEGCRVFFSRITLEDKSGAEYEPYIFAALNSAKVMVVLGTKSEYFDNVRVKNDWSRYLSLIKSGAKKTIIPAYRDMDPLDLPDEFLNFRLFDMSDPDFMQDLIRSIKKAVVPGRFRANAQVKKSDAKSEGGFGSAASGSDYAGSNTADSLSVHRSVSESLKSIKEAIKAKINKRNIGAVSVSAAAAVILLVILMIKVIIPGISYKRALAAVDAGKYGEAYKLLGS